MPHNSRPPLKAAAAVARLARLRDAGAPRILTPAQAWHLSGGVIGNAADTGYDVPLARVARDVPDCEAFVDDLRTMWAAS